MRTADEETEGIVVSDDVLQTDSLVPAGSGLFYATNLNERGDLRGHVRKQKLPLKKRFPGPDSRSHKNRRRKYFSLSLQRLPPTSDGFDAMATGWRETARSLNSAAEPAFSAILLA